MTDLDPKHIERIYREMGWTPNPHVCDEVTCVESRSWRNPRLSTKKRDYFDYLPDPLADTPEGDHAWWEIMRHFERKGWRFVVTNLYGLEGHSYDVAVFSDDAHSGEADSPNLKAAVLAALADAIGETE